MIIESEDFFNNTALINRIQANEKNGCCKFLKIETDNPKIIDIGAGTGAYSIPLANEGYDVTAVELIKHNLMILRKNSDKVKTYLGNAIDLHKFKDNTFDMVLLFGPMYHLISMNEKVQSLKEAKRVVKPNGIIMISYCMNEYAIITHGFIDNNIKDALNKQEIDDEYHIQSKPNELYSFVRLEDINYLKDTCELNRVKIIAQDGPTEYIKKIINKMNDDELDLFFKYHLATCEREELLGASRHILDILRK